MQVEEAHLEGRHQRHEHAPKRHETFPQGCCPRVGRDDPRARPQQAHELTVAAHIRAKRLAPLHRLHLLVALEEQCCLVLRLEGGSCCRHGRGVGARASTAAALALQGGRDRVEQLARGLLDGAADGHVGRRWQLVLQRQQALTHCAHVIDPMFMQQADQTVHPFRRDVRRGHRTPGRARLLKCFQRSSSMLKSTGLRQNFSPNQGCFLPYCLIVILYCFPRNNAAAHVGRFEAHGARAFCFPMIVKGSQQFYSTLKIGSTPGHRAPTTAKKTRDNASVKGSREVRGLCGVVRKTH